MQGLGASSLTELIPSEIISQKDCFGHESKEDFELILAGTLAPRSDNLSLGIKTVFSDEGNGS